VLERFNWDKMVWTPEDWHPCFAGGRVEVRLGCTQEDGKVVGWVLTVSGNDDTYRQRFYAAHEGPLALRTAQAISDGIT
jgi:hypothetical protein